MYLNFPMFFILFIKQPEKTYSQYTENKSHRLIENVNVLLISNSASKALISGINIPSTKTKISGKNMNFTENPLKKTLKNGRIIYTHNIIGIYHILPKLL